MTTDRVTEPFSVVELFAGIGGFGLAFERCGFHVTDQVEIDPYCLAVLKKRFPDARQHTDVRQVGSHNLPRPTVLCGGFPCQPHSLAGKRKGSEDSRDLWVEFARLVGELRPRWVVAENVPAIRTSDGGWYFWRVLSDLAACGYDAEWDCVPASAIGANHQRDRIWIVAYPAVKSEREPADEAHAHAVGRGARDEPSDGGADVPDAGGERLEIGNGIRPGRPGACAATSSPGGDAGVPTGADAPSGGQRIVWQSSGARGLPNGVREAVSDPHIFAPERIADARAECCHWSIEPDVGRVADGIPSRVDRLRALGNSLVPQVVEVIARRILEIELDG